MFVAALGIEVHVFEPQPGNLHMLRCSAFANKFTNMHVNGFGISNVTTEGGCMVCLGILYRYTLLSFFPRVQKLDLGPGNSYFDPTGTHCDFHGLKLRRLDDYWEQVLQRRRVTVLKVDVEGLELFVFNGAKQMLSEAPPKYIFMEFFSAFFHRQGITPKESAQLLRDLIGVYGYRITEVRTDQTVVVDLEDASYYANSEKYFDFDLVHRTVQLDRA